MAAVGSAPVPGNTQPVQRQILEQNRPATPPTRDIPEGVPSARPVPDGVDAPRGTPFDQLTSAGLPPTAADARPDPSTGPGLGLTLPKATSIQAASLASRGVSPEALKSTIAAELDAAGLPVAPEAVEALVDDYAAYREQHGRDLRNPNVMFNYYGQLDSRQPRSVIIDMSNGEVVGDPMHVSHGRGHRGPSEIPHEIPAILAELPHNHPRSPFGDRPSSNKTPLGLFRASHTVALSTRGLPRLEVEGVSPGVNRNARARGIAIQSAPYVAPGRERSRVGRSEGSMSISMPDAGRVFGQLRGGMVYNWAPTPGWR